MHLRAHTHALARTYTRTVFYLWLKCVVKLKINMKYSKEIVGQSLLRIYYALTFQELPLNVNRANARMYFEH